MLVSSLMPLFAQKKTSFWFYCGRSFWPPAPTLLPTALLTLDVILLCWFRWSALPVKLAEADSNPFWPLPPRFSPHALLELDVILLCWFRWSVSNLTWIAACLACILSQRCWFSFSLSDIAKPLVIALSVRVTCTSAARWCCCSCCAAAAFVSCVEKMAFDRC